MRLSLRPAGHLIVLLLAVRLLVDLATPLLPGAFSLDPDEPAVAARPSHVALNAATGQSPTIARHAASSTWSEASGHPSPARVSRHLRTAVPRITYRAEPTASTPSPDDD